MPYLDLLFDKANSVKFTTIVKELESAGILAASKSYPFEFNVEKAYETYSGINVRLRYFVRVTISRNYKANVVKELDVIVRNPQSAAVAITGASETPQPGIKMEVGIEECLHIEFEFDKQKYNLKVRQFIPYRIELAVNIRCSIRTGCYSWENILPSSAH